MTTEIDVQIVRDGRGESARQFIRLPHTLYEGNPCWVPWFDSDMKNILNRNHPFFEHSDGAFFLALKNGKPAGRICVLEHKPFNEYQKKRHARFYFFESIDSQDVADTLLNRARTWAEERELRELYGPMGFSGMTGGGILIKGFNERAAMTMMAYHHEYYQSLVEKAGFTKYKDFHSAYLSGVGFVLPERIQRAAEITLKRGRFSIPEIKTRKELKAYAMAIGKVYNEAWVDHEEYCPLTDKELEQLVASLLTVADPKLIKVILYDGEVAGFLLAFPDLSAAIQRSHGKLNLRSLIGLKREFKRFDHLIVNGIGILPKYQGTGGNALLYYALTETGTNAGVKGADMPQIAETTMKMLGDMKTLGGEIYKTHRVYKAVLNRQ